MKDARGVLWEDVYLEGRKGDDRVGLRCIGLVVGKWKQLSFSPTGLLR